MILLSYKELREINIVPNRVLIQVIDNQSNLLVNGEKYLKIDTQFSEEKHAPITGIIVNYSNTLISELMEWKTSLDICIGDYAVYTYTSAIHALTPEHGREFIDEYSNKYLMIDYGDIICVKRGSAIIPINGYLLVEPLEEEYASVFKLPTLTSMRYGRIAYTSKKNEYYISAGVKRNDTYDPIDEINPNDIIVFSHFSDIPLEYEAHLSFNKGKKYLRMQRRDIFAVVNQEIISDVNILG